MRSSVSANIVLAGMAVGLASLFGCSSEAEPGGAGDFFPSAGSGNTNTSGNPGVSGSTGTSGSSATAGAGGVTTTAGAGGMSTAGAGGSATAGAGGAAGASGGNDITKVWKSNGCGKPFAGQSGAKVTIQTMGTKDADCAAHLNGQPKCGPWSVARDFYVYLPQTYDNSKAYTLIFEGPGCGGNGTQVYPYNNNVDGTAIRVGLTPPPNSIGHGTNENQGCFDDKEGDDSVDWVFYENVYDKLNEELCFDKNRVFSGGNSSGSWFSNELGCKYAGDPKRPVRGVMPNTGGLPAEKEYVPTCTTAPMAGMWIHETGDITNGFDGNKRAIARAMKVNKCAKDSYDTATFENFPIGGNQPPDVCKRIKDCDPLYPLVVCPLTGTGHGSHDEVVNPGVSTFIKLFQNPPLFTP